MVTTTGDGAKTMVFFHRFWGDLSTGVDWGGAVDTGQRDSRYKLMSHFQWDFQGPPRTWDPLMVSGTHTIPIPLP